MKKIAKKKITPKKVKVKEVITDPLLLEYPQRLSELEGEIRLYPARTKDSPPAALADVRNAEVDTLGEENVVRFSWSSKKYAAGYSDFAFAGANRARGVRKIRLYNEDDVAVLGIVGDFESHSFGANFQFRAMDIYVAGPWEALFVEMTDELRDFRARKKEEFRKKRAALHR